MRPALDPAGHQVRRTKSTCLLHTWRPHRWRPFALVLHLHQHQSSRNLHLQYLAKNRSTQRCQSFITPRSDHPPVLEPHMILTKEQDAKPWCARCSGSPNKLWMKPHVCYIMEDTPSYTLRFIILPSSHNISRFLCSCTNLTEFVGNMCNIYL
jgi:hypothetical protein